MADLDEEFARFAAELKSVEEATKTVTTDDAAPAPLAPPPLAPPPLVPPPVPQASQPAAAAVAPPPLVPPPILPPPPTGAPTAAAATAGGYAAPAPAGYGAPTGMDYQQQQYMAQQLPGYSLPPQQQLYGQPDPSQLPYPPPPAAAAGSWAAAAGGITSGPGSGSVNSNPNAPADPETLKRLKEELMQQKQQDSKSGAAAEKAKSKVIMREAAGKKWVDTSLQEWPDNDFRIFVGDIGNEVNDDVLAKAFQRYPSFAKAKVIRDKRTNKSKGYGIVSLLDGNDFAKALKEMNGKYIGNRPCKLSKSTWNARSLKGGGGGGGGGGGKRKAEGYAGGGGGGGGGAAGGGSNKHHKSAPKFKYHVPILRQ